MTQLMPLVVSISQGSEELRLHNLVENSDKFQTLASKRYLQMRLLAGRFVFFFFFFLGDYQRSLKEGVKTYLHQCNFLIPNNNSQLSLCLKICSL
jgi:hypothetical protein